MINMKIYLLQDIPNLGKKGEIKNVADGYALNYLLPKKIAKRSDLSILKKVNQEKEQKLTEEKKKEEQAKKIALEIKKIILEIPLKFAERGKEAYDSVNKKRIVEELQSRKIYISENQILLKKPLKKEGIYIVDLNLSPKIKASLKIRIKAVIASKD